MPCTGLTPLPYSKSPNISVWIKNETHFTLIAAGVSGTSWTQTLSAGDKIKKGESRKVGVLDKAKPNSGTNYGWLYLELDLVDFQGKKMQFYLWEKTTVEELNDILIENDSFKGTVGWAAPSSQDNPNPEPLTDPFHYSCHMDDNQDLFTFDVFQTNEG